MLCFVLCVVFWSFVVAARSPDTHVLRVIFSHFWFSPRESTRISAHVFFPYRRFACHGARERGSMSESLGIGKKRGPTLAPFPSSWTHGYFWFRPFPSSRLLPPLLSVPPSLSAPLQHAFTSPDLDSITFVTSVESLTSLFGPFFSLLIFLSILSTC